MRKIIWSCWLEGREVAPAPVGACLRSWEEHNPGWDFRCLNAETIGQYLDLNEHVDLTRQQITAASLSDILRLLLLHEYGGVWVDATTFCTTPLDTWLEQAAQTGFFAFARPGEGRELATWFLAARPGNRLLAKWAARALSYWQERDATDDYFWVHHQFGELIAIDRSAFADWQAVPQISADGPHSVQFAGLHADYDEVKGRVDWSATLFKLTYRVNYEQLGINSLLIRLLGSAAKETAPAASAILPAVAVSHLRVGTENLGDHIQIIAGDRLSARAGWLATARVDRDNEIANPPPGDEKNGTGILLNGWFKTNPAQWPPHRSYLPLYLGFHIRLFQSPSLVSPEAIDHYKAHGPIGCRDRYTLSLLRAHGVDAFLSHCLTLTYPRRLPDVDRQTEVFVVSRDPRIQDYLPADIGPYTFVSHYSGDDDFAANMIRARRLLDTYRTRARLIITTLLHCALPAIAMGIPVIVLYPLNDGAARESDRQRFSSLSDIVRVFELSEINLIDWSGCVPDVGDIKLRLIDAFFSMARKWGTIATPRIGRIAPASALPVPKDGDTDRYFEDPDRLTRLALARAPDRQRWGAVSSYRSEGSVCAEMAAKCITSGEKVLEIGAGAGGFRTIVADRCQYTGVDLEPIDSQTLRLNLDDDPLPAGPWDAIVLLGVLAYLHRPVEALSKIFAAAGKVVFSYCCARDGDLNAVRQRLGWVNSFTEGELVALANGAGFALASMDHFNSADDFDQKIFVFVRIPTMPPG